MVDSTLDINEVLTIEIPVIEEDYPDQQTEVRAEMLMKGMFEFVVRVVGDHTESEEEREDVLWGIVRSIVETRKSRSLADLLRKRLENRPGRSEWRGMDPGGE